MNTFDYDLLAADFDPMALDLDQMDDEGEDKIAFEVSERGFELFTSMINLQRAGESINAVHDQFYKEIVEPWRLANNIKDRVIVFGINELPEYC